MRSPAVNASKVVLESLAAIAISAATASPLAPPAVTPARSGHGYWLEAIPESLEEAALRDALARSAFGGGPGPAEGLARVTAAHPGTVASGLAQLAAGFALLDAGKEAEAIAYLTHPDIQKTALTSQALSPMRRSDALNCAISAGWQDANANPAVFSVPASASINAPSVAAARRSRRTGALLVRIAHWRALSPNT